MGKQLKCPVPNRAKSWEGVTENYMKRVLALQFLTGIAKKPEVAQYWSTNPLIKTPIFNEVMSRNRFQAIFEFLHFNGNSNYNPNDPDRDRLYKVRSLIEHL